LLADLVRQHRHRIGLTQEVLADRCGVAVRTIRAIEAGRIIRPRPATVRLLADVFALTGEGRERFLRVALDAAGPAADQTEPAVPRPVPAQLPADVPAFTGRDAELAALDTFAASDRATTAVSGTAGVGKTALAVRWGHRAAGRFPDGQLYLNLRGYDPDQPVTPTEALARLLESLGVPGGDIPLDIDACAAAYRSHVGGRRMFILLDNAANVDQVRPLLPDSPACTVVITSRDRMAGLAARDGVHRIDLDLLPPGDALTLLRQLIGDRIDAEPDGAATLIELCAHLPLAVRIAAELAAARPDTSIANLVAELADHRQRLTLLGADGDPHTAVTAVFSWSVRHLSPQAARTFRLLGLHPGPDISAPAAASLTGAAPTDVRPWLAELVRANLLGEPTPGRYSQHDLLRAYGRNLAERTEPVAQRQAASHRVLGHYLYTGHAASIALDPNRDGITLADPVPGTTPEPMPDLEAAMDWFAAERAVMLRAVQQAGEAGLDVHMWQLAWTIGPYLHRRGHWHDLVASQRLAVSATRRVNDPRNEAVAHRLLGRAFERMGLPEESRAHYFESLRLYEAVAPHDSGRPRTHTALADLAFGLGEYQEALRHSEQALDLYAASGNRAGEGAALNSVAWYHAELGALDQARSYCERAIAVLQKAAERHGEAAAWDTLGYIHHRAGQYDRAIDCYRRSADFSALSGHRFNESASLIHIGDTHQANGDVDGACTAWQRALELLTELEHPEADAVRAKLRQVRAATSGK
jgi:tetratricopeptide (TPR) repeat protein/transcriptional regulator with XRE-family HTH domain